MDEDEFEECQRAKRRQDAEDSTANYPAPKKLHQKSYTLRISNIPTSIDARILEAALSTSSTFKDTKPIVKSLSLCYDNASDTAQHTATVTLGCLPLELKDKAKTYPCDLQFKTSSMKVEKCTVSFDRNFEGFTPISPYEQYENHSIDCIALHGWGGHAFGSFKEAGESQYMWLRDSLPIKFKKLRIWLYGYDSDLKNTTTIASKYEWADSFMRNLRILRTNSGSNAKGRPIIFIVHSLGGLILKEAMTLMSESDNPADHLTLELTYGALFFGVPNQGMETSSLAPLIAKNPSRYTLNQLDPQLGSRPRDREHQDFCKAFNFRDSKIVQFYELQKSSTYRRIEGSEDWTGGGPKQLLVDRNSATSGRSWETNHSYLIPLDKDHKSLVKFSANERCDYDIVVNVLDAFQTQAPQVIQCRRKGKQHALRTLTSDESECLRSLAFKNMEFRKLTIENPATGTGSWIFEHQLYLNWIGGQGGLLWLCGHPGTGKSTLMHHVVNLVEEIDTSDEISISFFCHGRGEGLQKSRLGLFRCLLNQTLARVPSSLAKLTSKLIFRQTSQGKVGRDWDWEVNEVQDLFEETLIEAAETRMIRIYIDALDECGPKDAGSVIHSLWRVVSVQPRISILFSSRPYPTIPLPDIRTVIFVQDQNKVDITKYIYDQLHHLAFSNGNQDLRRKILGRSRSNFQWVGITVARVLEMYTEGRPYQKILQIVESLPKDLRDLYEHLLHEPVEEIRNESFKMISWILFARRPLTTKELLWAMTMDIEPFDLSVKSLQEMPAYADDIQSMERMIRSCTKGLAEVKDYTVQFVHQSVVDFFYDTKLQAFKQNTPTQSIVGQANSRLSYVCLQYLRRKEIEVSAESSALEVGQNRIGGYDAGQTRENILATLLPFLSYAWQFWAIHARLAEKEGIKQSYLVDLLESPLKPYRLFFMLEQNGI
ncbi:MAG: hypothetical protein M1814_004255 [Vezdaea aestivalis]|nr:MAG: hypothetical protein M1814_004255 [Vezdaea aestivalis]